MRQLKYSDEEFARRGQEIYQSQIKDDIEAEHRGRIVAIDIETGAYAIADRSVLAAKQLLEQNPDAQLYGIRIGYPAVHRFGFHASKLSE